MTKHIRWISVAAAAMGVLVVGMRSAHASPVCNPLGTTVPCTWVPNGDYPQVVLDAMDFSAFAGATPLTADAVSAANGENLDYWPIGTDVNGDGVLIYHLAYFNTDASAPAHGKLLLFLPGSGGYPAEYTHFLTRAAYHGFNVIGLQFIDDVPERSCYNTANLTDVVDCQNVQHRYDFNGTAIPLDFVTTGVNNPLAGYRDDSSPTGIFPSFNSVRHRLVEVLRYLKQNFPDQGWDAFLAGPSHDGSVAPFVNWNLVTFAGHSHGGGVAAWMAQTNALDRLLMFNATAVAKATSEHDDPVGPAVFANLYDPVSFPNATHPEVAYGFTWWKDSTHHAFDYIYSLANWVQQQLPGSRGNVDITAPTTEHMLFGSHDFSGVAGTNCDPAKPSGAGHISTIIDLCEPGKTSGWYYSFVWDYMMGY